MLKRLKSVSMLLFLGTFSTGTISAVTASEVNASAIVQQNETCKGIVKDATGESIIGASVIVKGTTNGAITDFEGNFALTNVKKGDIIVISYVGIKNKKSNGMVGLSM